jgi:hypothetical protein
MSERWGMTSHEFSTLVPGHLRLRWWLLLLLNGSQSLTDGLNCIKNICSIVIGGGGGSCCC